LDVDPPQGNVFPFLKRGPAVGISDCEDSQGKAGGFGDVGQFYGKFAPFIPLGIDKCGIIHWRGKRSIHWGSQQLASMHKFHLHVNNRFHLEFSKDIVPGNAKVAHGATLNAKVSVNFRDGERTGVEQGWVGSILFVLEVHSCA
jgi:hypothetical protein